MKRILLVAFAALVSLGGPGLILPVWAGQEWGLIGEEVVRFDATVVDVMCALTGDCPAACGGGSRQLGLLTDQDRLILAHKNFVPFAGAAAELADFCGKRVTVDGLFATNRGVTVFALQFVREAPDGKWRRANRFQAHWAAEHGVAADSTTAKRWFRNDPRVEALIARDGVLGLGPGVVPAE